MKISNFDVILVGAFILIAMSCLAEFYLLIHGLPGFSAGYWAFITTVTTGEIATYSLYRTSKQGGVKQAAKSLLNGNKLVQADMEEPDGQTQEP